eukprot:CAMPEP_0115147196 /NCGR_PEP_ID=MMETSP0227-20121206/63158_1 /TAXON_ID=89957 /ORGANISM="Polarella glacialis, Strain CCMP 1383" /LENGTH=55 /DNA_ID=CAMNT_0002557041 /DNA_START=40 /DNA_END=207 /DNA_ORIENTATION=-
MPLAVEVSLLHWDILAIKEAAQSSLLLKVRHGGIAKLGHVWSGRNLQSREEAAGG